MKKYISFLLVAAFLSSFVIMVPYSNVHARITKNEGSVIMMSDGRGRAKAVSAVEKKENKKSKNNNTNNTSKGKTYQESIPVLETEASKSEKQSSFTESVPVLKNETGYYRYGPHDSSGEPTEVKTYYDPDQFIVKNQRTTSNQGYNKNYNQNKSWFNPVTSVIEFDSNVYKKLPVNDKAKLVNKIENNESLVFGNKASNSGTDQQEAPISHTSSEPGVSVVVTDTKSGNKSQDSDNNKNAYTGTPKGSLDIDRDSGRIGIRYKGLNDQYDDVELHAINQRDYDLYGYDKNNAPYDSAAVSKKLGEYIQDTGDSEPTIHDVNDYFDQKYDTLPDKPKGEGTVKPPIMDTGEDIIAEQDPIVDPKPHKPNTDPEDDYIKPEEKPSVEEPEKTEVPTPTEDQKPEEADTEPTDTHVPVSDDPINPIDEEDEYIEEPLIFTDNLATVCKDINYPPGQWEPVGDENYMIKGVYAVRLTLTPVTPVNLSLMGDGQRLEWQRTHQAQSSEIKLTNFGIELKKIQDEGLLEKIKTMDDKLEAKRMFEDIKDRLDVAKRKDVDINPEINLKKENIEGFSRGSVFTVTQEMQTVYIAFGHKEMERKHFKCEPMYERTVERDGKAFEVYKPVKVIADVEGPVEIPEDKRLLYIDTGNWRPLESYQIISARCAQSLNFEIERAYGEIFQNDPYLGSGKTGRVLGMTASFYNHLPIKFFYGQAGCKANLKAVSDRNVEKIPNNLQFFRDGQKRTLEFDPFYPVMTAESNNFIVPKYASYSEVAKWDQSTPKELSLYVDSNLILTKERQDQMKGHVKGFEFDSTWASEEGKPTRFMFLYDYLAETFMKTPTKINANGINNFTNQSAGMVLTVPVSSVSKEHHGIEIINLPKDIIPIVRQFISVARDQHFTINFVKAK